MALVPPAKDMRESGPRIVDDQYILLLFPGAKLEDLGMNEGERFCGTVWGGDIDSTGFPTNRDGKTVFVCGSVAQASPEYLKPLTNIFGSHRVFVVADVCPNYGTVLPNDGVVGLGRLPILVHGPGVHYR